MNFSKMAEPTELPFEMWTQVGPRNHVLDEVEISTREGIMLRAKRFWLRTCPMVDILKAVQQEQNCYGADANWSVLDEGARLHCMLNMTEPSVCKGDEAFSNYFHRLCVPAYLLSLISLLTVNTVQPIELGYTFVLNLLTVLDYKKCHDLTS